VKRLNGAVVVVVVVGLEGLGLFLEELFQTQFFSKWVSGYRPDIYLNIINQFRVFAQCMRL
jgi:hypothetical protein